METPILEATYHDRLSVHGNAPLLTQQQIENLQDGAIVYVQWPEADTASPYRIRVQDFKDGYDRPWVYATNFHHYHEQPCRWDKEISGYGLHKVSDLKVWVRDPPPEPAIEEGEIVFMTILWD